MIPTNRPIRRTDNNDRIYKTRREKYNAVIKEIKDAHAKSAGAGRYSERRSFRVAEPNAEARENSAQRVERKVPHARGEIVARAGQPGTVTISTNMAGRGTDIKLGPRVIEVGGLMVVGTERHEARRIDRQLRGRCARQGDPGASRFT
jgi:Preprotein translocase subunit SecA (ATPase, RNA helicase)